MRKILCLLVIAALAAQICARPDDKADAAAKAAKEAEDKAKKEAEKAKDATKDAAKDIKDDADKAEKEAKDIGDDIKKGAEDCAPVKPHKKPHHGGIISTGAKILKKVDDTILGWFEDLPF